ncbi:urease accessory protein UreH domain-containing protein [Thermococcus paralvinellae]|uniref:Uncharacterized protein n=1 Tax=Thermococcus paralvinellae TaxID=582419 RepID=W0I2D3_9EURY|nr:cytochrome c biogenesis protein CcdA [Thermococcus paralvinellae]AHF80179.1 Hypothetical protein TES1_0793 [Thermococcus paralvinellae]
MKRTSILIFLLLITSALVKSFSTVEYGNVEFIPVATESELNEVIDANEGQYILIYYYSLTCPACKYMRDNVFIDPNVVQLLSERAVPVIVDIYKGREVTSLRYKIYSKVLVIQPDNLGYYTPKSPGEEITVSVPGTPTMVIFKVENGEKILTGVAVGALNKQGFEFFIKETTKKRANIQTSNFKTSTTTVVQTQNESHLTFAVLLTIFSAGILSVFSPCVLPLVVSGFALILAKRNLQIIILGMIAAFSLIGGLAGALGSYVAQITALFYLIGGAGFIVLGTIMVSEKANLYFTSKMNKIQRLAEKNRKFKGKFADFLFGAALGATWIGCIAPYVGFAILTATLSGNFTKGVIVMFIYALGMGLTFYLILSSKDLAQWINKKFLSNKITLKGSDRKWEKAIGILMILIGILMLTELTPLKLWSHLFEKIA